MYIHQTGMRRDDDLELEWGRQREIAKIEEMWESEPAIAAGSPGQPAGHGLTRPAAGCFRASQAAAAMSVRAKSSPQKSSASPDTAASA